MKVSVLRVFKLEKIHHRNNCNVDDLATLAAELEAIRHELSL